MRVDELEWMRRCVSGLMGVFWDWPCVLSCGNVSTGVMKQTEHLVLQQNWPVYPPEKNIDCLKVDPQLKDLSAVSSPDRRKRREKKTDGGSWRSIFHLADR